MYVAFIKNFITGEANSYIYPSFIKEYIGKTAVFQCGSAGNTMWFFNKKKLPYNVYLNNNNSILSIFPIEVANSGDYYCYGYDMLFQRYFIARSQLMPIGKLYFQF